MDDDEPGVSSDVKHYAPCADPAKPGAISAFEKFDIAGMRIAAHFIQSLDNKLASARGISRIARRAGLAISKSHFMPKLVERDEIAALECRAPSCNRDSLFGSRKVRQDAQKLCGRYVLIGLGQLSRLFDRFIK